MCVDVYVCVCVRDAQPPPVVLPCVEWQHQSSCTIADLCSVSDCINTEWVGFLMQNSSIDHFGKIPQPHSLSSPLSLLPITNSLCWFLPIDKSLCPIAFVKLSVKQKVLLIWSSFSAELHIPCGKNTISTSSNSLQPMITNECSLSYKICECLMLKNLYSLSVVLSFRRPWLIC